MGKTKITKEQLDLYKDDYNESDFWNKIKKYGKDAGAKVVYKALELFYASESSETPLPIKGLIYGALGYFIFPVDAIPDILPVVGFADDLVALGIVIASASASITPAVKKQAENRMKDWFGDISNSDIED